MSDQPGDGVSRRSLVVGVTGLVSLSGCLSHPLPDTTPEEVQNDSSADVRDPPKSLSVTEVEIVRQHGKVGVSGVVNNADGFNGKSACARVALYDDDELVLEDHIMIGEGGGDFGPFVKWWDVDAETAERVDAPAAEFVAERCYNVE